MNGQNLTKPFTFLYTFRKTCSTNKILKLNRNKIFEDSLENLDRYYVVVGEGEEVKVRPREDGEDAC